MTNSEQGEGELPWSERINQLSIHPEAASMRDIAKMAGELSEANWNVSALQAKVADLEKALADKQAEVIQWRIEMDCFYTTIEKLARKIRAEFEIAKAQKNSAEINALSRVNDVILAVIRARLIRVIETDLETRGDGTPENPYRVIRQYWSLAGELLAEVDAFQSPTTGGHV